MENIVGVFGLDWKILAINAINFGILLAALTYFLYKPMMRALEARQQKIAQGVHDAQRASEELAATEASRSEMLAEAGKEADSILAQSRQAGSQKEREIVNSAEAAAARVLKEAEAQANDMKVSALSESKHEVAKLIVLGIEKALGHSPTGETMKEPK